MTVEELYQAIGGSYESAVRVMQNDGIIGRIIRRFPEDEAFPDLARAAAAGDEAGIFRAAHTMKGVCGNLGLDALAAGASEITEAFRPGSPRSMDPETLGEKLKDMEALYDRTLAGIRAFAEQ